MRIVVKLFGALVVLVLACALGYGAYRNPESATLDDAARAGAPGKFIAGPNGLTHYQFTPVISRDSMRIVVLVHGFSVPFYIWDSTVVALTKAGKRTLRYDVYGRGLSDRPDAAYDGAMFDAQLLALLDSLRIKEPVDLVGLSYGGFIVSHFVTTHRDRVRTLTLVDPVASSSQLPWYITSPVLGPWFFQTMAVPGMAEGQPGDFLHPEHFPDWVDRYRPQMRYRGFGRSLLRSRLTTSHADFPALFRAVASTGVPVLLVWGKQDPTVPIRLSDGIRSAIPSLEFVPVDSSGHLPHMEQSATTHRALLAFLAKH